MIWWFDFVFLFTTLQTWIIKRQSFGTLITCEDMFNLSMILLTFFLLKILRRKLSICITLFKYMVVQWIWFSLLIRCSIQKALSIILVWGWCSLSQESFSWLSCVWMGPHVRFFTKISKTTIILHNFLYYLSVKFR